MIPIVLSIVPSSHRRDLLVPPGGGVFRFLAFVDLFYDFAPTPQVEGSAWRFPLPPSIICCKVKTPRIIAWGTSRPGIGMASRAV